MHFSHKMPLYNFYTIVQKSQRWPKTQIKGGGSCLKGEVRAICRFWVFDGNGLLGHRLIYSRWFEMNPPAKSGWKRRSKNTPTYWYFVRKCLWRNMCFQVRTILSSHLVCIHFCVWFGLFVDRWWLREVWYAPDFLSNCSTRVPLAAPGITRSLIKWHPFAKYPKLTHLQ